MATFNAASNLNAEANLFSPVSMSKLQMNVLKIPSEVKDIDGNDYEEKLDQEDGAEHRHEGS